jgi:colanic acid biosynthesis protein WcaH
MLSNQELLEVIQRTPLVSIDLVARDSDSRMLLGLRMNEPAKDTWFVPGGRILKDESLDDAFTRITRSELGIECLRSQACFLGLFTHIDFQKLIFQTSSKIHKNRDEMPLKYIHLQAL